MRQRALRLPTRCDMRDDQTDASDNRQRRAGVAHECVVPFVGQSSEPRLVTIT